jgi:plastocyanin
MMRFFIPFLMSLAATTANATDVVTVAIEKFAFSPKDITVAPGTKIVWINKDQIPHTISTADKSFMSKAMDTDDKFEQTFVNAGDFSYFCTLHPFMTGTVHVRVAPGAAATASTK